MAKRKLAEQLPRPASLDEAVQRRNDLCQIHDYVEDLTADLMALRANNKRLKQKLRQVSANNKWLKHDLVTARTLHRQYCDTLAAGAAQFGCFRGRSAASGAKVAIEDILLQLLKCAHPDRWCQGQLATELAHELTVAINAVRARQGGEA